jgi:glucose-1-phosphate cytidylyltransferase
MPSGLPSVAILCGGRGTRLQEQAPSLPKPLVEIGGQPIVWHVVRIYAAQGYRRFLLLTGHRSEAVEEFVAAASWPDGIEVECVFTGEDTPTGGRIHRARDAVGEGTFAVTYADGVADIDLAGALGHHRGHDGLATMTVVRPELQFGVTEIGTGDRVTGFREKPRSDHWINGGFFFFEPGALDYLDETSVLERAPLEGLAADDQLHVWRHTGFWRCMDTYKDAVSLNDLWAAEPPWKVWA